MEGDFIEMVMSGKYNKRIQLNNDINICRHYNKVENLLQQVNCNIITQPIEPIFINYYNIYDLERTDFKPSNLIYIKKNEFSNNLLSLCIQLRKYGMNINFTFECSICKEYKTKLFSHSLDTYTNKNLYIQMKNNYNIICNCSKLNNIFDYNTINDENNNSYIKYIEIIPFYTFQDLHYYMIDSINTPIIVYIV